MKKSVLVIICHGIIILLNPYRIMGQGNNSWGYQLNVITTTVPFLLITPDARSGGMADVGVAISPDANSMYWNPAKLAFEPEDIGFSLSYTPWLTAIYPGLNLVDLGVYKKIDDRSGFGISAKYFTQPDDYKYNKAGAIVSVYHPYEFSIDAGYARKLSKYFSLGISGRYIYSNLWNDTLPSGLIRIPGKAFAMDLSCYYTNQIKVGKLPSEVSFGVNISNVGPKINYFKPEYFEFLPANLKLGSCLNLHLDSKNELAFAIEFNKLLVPTPPIYQLDSNNRPVVGADGKKIITRGMDPDVSVFQGMLQSFYDAPQGLPEELVQINTSFAVEYWYKRMLALRAGYFYESPTKGDRQYLTIGIGGRYKRFSIDLAYLIPTPTNNSYSLISPLANTFRFTLSYNISKNKQ